MLEKPSMGDKQYNDLNKSYRERYGEYKRDLLLWEQANALDRSNQLAEQKLRDEIEREEQRRQDTFRQERLYEQMEERKLQERLSEQVEKEVEEQEIQETLMKLPFIIDKMKISLEEMRQSYEQRMRYYKLCNDLDLNYDDIEKLCMWVNRPTNEQWNQLETVEKQYQSIFNTKELDDLYVKREQIIGKVNNDELDRTKKSLNRLEEEMVRDNGYINLSGIENIAGGTEEQLNQYIANNEKTIGLYNALILFVTIVSLVIAVTIEDASVVALIIGGFLDLVFFVNQDPYRKAIKIMQEAIAEHNEKVNKNRNEINEIRTKLELHINEWNNIENEINKYKEGREQELKDNEEFNEICNRRNYLRDKIYDKSGGDNSLNGQEFYEFRIKHYNEDVERLFRKLGIDVFRKIKKEDIKGNGSVKDYENYIEDNVLYIDNLYFEDYKAYRENEK